MVYFSGRAVPAARTGGWAATRAASGRHYPPTLTTSITSPGPPWTCWSRRCHDLVADLRAGVSSSGRAAGYEGRGGAGQRGPSSGRRGRGCAARVGAATAREEVPAEESSRFAPPPHGRGSANTATGSSGVVGRGGVAAESGGEGATVAGGDIREERAAAKSRGAAERTIERRRDREPGREGVDGGDGRRDQDGGGWIGNLG
jgi:hypothetical protein